MKQEDIKKAAEEYEDNLTYAPVSKQYDVCIAFMKGANWRINSVWHDATEKPKIGELIIVETYGKIWDYGEYDVRDTFHPKARWAYMKDLLPNSEDNPCTT